MSGRSHATPDRAHLITLVARPARGDAPSNTPHATGRLHLTFTERSPHSIFKVMMRRAPFKKFGDPDRQREYNLADESFEVFVAPNYKPDKPHGIFVFISAGDADIPQPWQDVFARHKLIAISANNTGNGRDARYRMALALDAVHNLSKLYTIDDDRVFLGGFSGGAAASAWLITGYPDVFRGGYFMMGGLMFYQFHSQGEQILPTVLRDPWEAPIDQLKKDMRLVFLIGQRDVYSPPQARISYQTLVLDGFVCSALIEVPGLGHAHPDARSFEKGILALDNPRPGKPPTTAPTDDPHPLPAQIAQAKRLLSTAQYFLARENTGKARQYAQQVLDEYPTTPWAKAARELLRKLDASAATQPAKSSRNRAG
jgi:hypothetical protein